MNHAFKRDNDNAHIEIKLHYATVSNRIKLFGVTYLVEQIRAFRLCNIGTSLPPVQPSLSLWPDIVVFSILDG